METLDRVIRILDKVGVFSRWANVVGIAFLFLLVSFTFVDVIMRYIFSRPTKGGLEITEVMMILAIFLAVAHTHNEKGHISVDLISTKIAPKARVVMEFITNLLGLGIFITATWRILLQTLWFVQKNAMHSQYFPIPCAPFAAIIVIGCTALSLLLLRDLLGNVAEALRLGLKWYHWLLMLGIPIAVVVLSVFWMRPHLWQLSLPVVGFIGVIFSLIFFLSGMPISFALILISFVFVGHIRGLDVALDMVGTQLYWTTGSYKWSVLPFFVLMGYLCLSARFGEDLYLAAYRWIGHLRGGMAVATVGACTGFAAIVGDPVSATATMGSVALPEMRKYKYDDRLSTGSITGGATLGPIIPPSVAFILYGLLTNLSIGELFISGIIPGLVISATFILIIYVWCRLNPSVGPPGERSAWRLRLVSLKAGGPVLVLFLLVIGGIYTGVFTPTEGGAIGAMVAFILGLAMMRFTWSRFAQSLLDAGKTISMVFLILIGAAMFTRFVAWCNLSNTVKELIIGLGLSPASFVLLALLVLLILGCFVDLMPIMLISVPLLYPISVALGINPIWFAVLVVIAINLGSLTPPVGMNLFVLKGLKKDMPMDTIYRGALPFVLGTVIALGLVFVFPSLATWLPGVLK